MKNRTPDQNLLDAVLLDEPAHAASLRVVRRAARRRRWNRHLRHGGLAAAVLMMSIAVLQTKRSVTLHPQPQTVREPSCVIHSHALPVGFLVSTRNGSVEIVQTIQTSVELFRTVNTIAPQRIDDETLLQLAPGAVLVRQQAGPAELIFPNITTHAGIESRAVHE